jgi:hypothetical protein
MCGEKIQEMKSERIIQRLSSEVVTRFMTILEAMPTWMFRFSSPYHHLQCCAVRHAI